MNTKEPLLKIRFDGEAVGPGKIPVPHLLRFLLNLNKVLQLAGQVLGGEQGSTQQGRPMQSIKDEVALDLALLMEGSSAAVLGFERGQIAAFPEADFGLEIEDFTTGRIVSIRIHDIERLEDRQNEAADLLPQDTPISRGFWESPTLEELATAQNVGPVTDVQALFGTWPGDEDDEFELAVDALRHQPVGEGNR